MAPGALLGMAAETDRAHALLQTFSSASVVSGLGLGAFCFVADRLLQLSVVQQHDWLRALADNTVHGAVGMWSWAIVIGLRKKNDFGEVLLAGFLASVIDVDHFFLAGSLSLKAQRLLVLSSLDAVSVLDFSSRPRWDSSRPVDLPLRKDRSLALLAVRDDHGLLPASLLLCHVSDGDQRDDVYKTRDSH
ncbi:transmembrane protein 267 isoform X2 [Tachyglossus aculeatus]|uniref:transmembrane protein 267 isoform X2 n=1 Tax=Tachyglossus aculeatus TaxID=9261 RepID=UPI0018F41B56|nr:transmembrane protein 267 isoform X2 [Tachyglossus aculeatus]